MLAGGLRAAMGPHVAAAKRHRGGQPPALPDRVSFEAVPYLGRTGVPPRDRPAEVGARDAAYNRPRRRVRSGAGRRRLEAPTADPALGEVRRVPIDPTAVRARRHAAGARRKK